MKLNTTSQYAIRILSSIAFDDTKRYNAKELSTTLNIPYKYLTKVMTYLVNAQLVESIRGRDGGYKLTRLPEEVYINDILLAVKEDLQEKMCLLTNQNCDQRKRCILHDDWQEPKELIHSMLCDKSLKDLKKLK